MIHSLWQLHIQPQNDVFSINLMHITHVLSLMPWRTQLSNILGYCMTHRIDFFTSINREINFWVGLITLSLWAFIHPLITILCALEVSFWLIFLHPFNYHMMWPWAVLGCCFWVIPSFCASILLYPTKIAIVILNRHHRKQQHQNNREFIIYCSTAIIPTPSCQHQDL